MKDHEDDVMVKDNNLGVVKAETKNYAFFMETTSIEYETQRRCSLTSVGNSLDEKGYGIAMRKSKYHEVRLLVILSRLPIQTGFEYHDSQITRRGCHSKTEEKMVGRKTRRGSMSCNV
jgi:hypothetical protein